MSSTAPDNHGPDRATAERILSRHRIATRYLGIGGIRYTVPAKTLTKLAKALLEGDAGKPEEDAALPSSLPARAPARCHLPPFAEGAGAFGISLQLYEVRSSRNWGIGDFEDLARACETAAATGADFIGLTPLHALFLADNRRCSPYSPSNRTFLNPLHIAVDRLAHAEIPDWMQAEAERLRRLDMVDYVAVAELKLAGLRLQFNAWRAQAPQSEDAAFRSFVDEGGGELRSHALFEALSAHMVKAGFGSGWKTWPETFRTRDATDVVAFGQSQSQEVEFHLWLQWIAATQLGQAARRAKDAGLRLGLYFDYAVGEAPDGSATWSNPRDYLDGFHIGAPPDPFSEAGQNWGLAVPSPRSFTGVGLARRRQQLQRILSLGGMFRLDHVMGLWQLFAIPEGEAPLSGAYIHYPISSALAMLADVSGETGTVVIGEDLGNVPDGFRELMQTAAILSYRLLCFEPVEEGRLELSKIPWQSLVCLSTHDLYPFRGWWEERDIARRIELGLLAEASSGAERQDRLQRKQALLAALSQAGIGDGRHVVDGPADDALLEDVHVLLARSPGMLLAARLADLLGEDEATNVPGTSEDRNWRRKVGVPVEAWADHPLFRRSTEALAKERPRRGRGVDRP